MRPALKDWFAVPPSFAGFSGALATNITLEVPEAFTWVVFMLPLT